MNVFIAPLGYGAWRGAQDEDEEEKVKKRSAERWSIMSKEHGASQTLHDAIGGLRQVAEALETRDERIRQLEAEVARLREEASRANRESSTSNRESSPNGVATPPSEGEQSALRLSHFPAPPLAMAANGDSNLSSNASVSSEVSNGSNSGGEGKKKSRLQNRAASATGMKPHESSQEFNKKIKNNWTTEVSYPGGPQTVQQLKHRKEETRERASSDDGVFFSSYSRLARVCSFREENCCGCSTNSPSVGADQFPQHALSRHAETLPPSLDLAATFAPTSASEPTTIQKGVEDLQNFKIEPRDANKKHAGYRLLTCNDQHCTMLKVPQGRIHIPHITKTLVQARWMRKPRTVLIVKKPGEPECADAMIDLARFLTRGDFKVTVVAEQAAFDRKRESDDFVHALRELAVVQASHDDIQTMPIDLCVAVGGDGTIIWLSHLFPRGCPPVYSIHMGSLGFLSAFALSEARSTLRSVIENIMVLTLRMRLEARVLPARKTRGSSSQGTAGGAAQTRVIRTVLNEIVVDRGPESSIINCDLFIGNSETPITHVQGDGIIVSTPTGSTAYSLSAGGSMVHPAIPCVAITPVCPHSLSFRPIVIPDTSQVRIKVNEAARSSAWVSFDGRDRLELKQGESVCFSTISFAILMQFIPSKVKSHPESFPVFKLVESSLVDDPVANIFDSVDKVTCLRIHSSEVIGVSERTNHAKISQILIENFATGDGQLKIAIYAFQRISMFLNKFGGYLLPLSTDRHFPPDFLFFDDFD
ncbi:NAD kinase [Hondaea fermentalgiana]|uniref:NAD kinase n=1 Tax=Hondaea fermentalgiana TaxID=2315210 RepID=A0A2R5H0G8_9STRA|nr:NAD kinase [Hondaea fermentalgiana]|eukprot:GBG34251.1 NAD kinase [Hondaea fermentalgiana]